MSERDKLADVSDGQRSHPPDEHGTLADRPEAQRSHPSGEHGTLADRPEAQRSHPSGEHGTLADRPEAQRSHPSDEHGALADRFEAQRSHLQAVAYRMLGSLDEAEDAVQETWLRLSRVDAEDVANLPGWLRTVVSRVCLDMLRARASRREDLTGQPTQVDHAEPPAGGDPQQEAILADSAGRALLVILDTLTPAERVAFVLHEMFAVPFGEIAPIVERSPSTTKKLASRARHKVRGTPTIGATDLARHRRVVEAFLTAARAGDVEAVAAVLAPGVVRRADQAALAPGRPAEARGRRTVAEEIAAFGANARFAEPALVNGTVGIVVAPRGRLLLALAITIEDDKITSYELIASPTRLHRLNLAMLDQ